MEGLSLEDLAGKELLLRARTNGGRADLFSLKGELAGWQATGLAWVSIQWEKGYSPDSREPIVCYSFTPKGVEGSVIKGTAEPENQVGRTISCQLTIYPGDKPESGFFACF